MAKTKRVGRFRSPSDESLQKRLGGHRRGLEVKGAVEGVNTSRFRTVLGESDIVKITDRKGLTKG